MRADALAAYLFTIALCMAASGQTIEYPSGEKPDEFLTDADGFPIQYWIAWEGYQPRSRWSEQSPPAGPPLPFVENEPYYALDYHQGEHGPYYLLARFQADRPGPPIGWVRADICFRNEAEMNPDTKVYQKAMIVNRIDDFVEGDVQLDASLQPSLAPAEDAEQTEHGYSLFNIFFQYARTTPGAYGTDEEEYVLIGNAQEFTSGTVRNVIQGWIPARRIVSWETREGWQWDHASTRPDHPSSVRRTLPGRVFSTPADAIAGLLDSDAPAEGHFDESFAESGESIPFAPHHMRYPNLPFRPSEDVLKASDGNELVKVGGIGNYGAMTAAEVDDFRKQIEVIAQAVTRTEILFVIDDTGSMWRYFSAVADMVARIYEDVRAHPERQVFVGVTFFNDVDGQPPGWNPVTPGPLVPAGSRDEPDAPYGGNIIEYIRNRQPNAGGDAREMVFLGIHDGFRAANFTQFARKLVILIGDAGDVGNRPQNPSPFDEDDMVDLLYGTTRVPVEFFAIQVSNPEADTASKAFQTQMTSIVDQLNERGNQNPNLRRTLGTYALAGRTDLLDRLNARYQELEQERQYYEETLTRIRMGQFHTEVSPELKATLDSFRVDLDRLRDAGGVQLFEEGYAWRFSPGLEEAGVPQVRSQLLLAETELLKVIDLMKHLTSRRGDLFGRRITVEEALTRLLASFLGEEPDPERSVADYLTMRKGLKVHSPLLNRPLQARFPERLALQEFEKIVHRVQLLEDIRNGVTRDWGQEQHQVQGAEITRWIAGPAIRAEEDRFFTLPGDTVRWYWIDVETEMP